MQSFHSSTGTLDEKRLKDDFEVLEYLRINKHKDQNNQNYLRFVNELLFAKKLKQDKLNHLNRQIESGCEQTQNKRRSDQEKREDINTKFHHEMEVKGDLEREVQECKKSIRLLRGDIGHIVKRNQSEKMLSSKINKVNIIASDQYKKVNNELSKQKQEVKQLKGMREIFMQRLKNASRIQKNGLMKTEQSFLQLLRKHRERNGSMIQQYSEMKRKTDTKKQTIIYGIQFITQLAQLVNSQQSQFVIQNFNKSDKQTLLQKTESLQQKSIKIIESISSTCKLNYPDISPKQIQQKIGKILSVFYTLQNNIGSLSSIYDDALKRLEYLKETVIELDIKDDQIVFTTSDTQSSKNIEDDMMQENTLQHLKCLYLFLSFFSSVKESNQMLLRQLIEYMSKSKKQRLSSHLFSDWENKIKAAVEEIKEIDLEDTTGLFSKMPKQYTSKSRLDRTVDATMDTPQIESRRSEGSKSLIFKEGGIFSNSSNNQPVYFRKNKIHLSKQSLCKSMSIENNLQRCKAKRIKFLQRIDQDYYKMLKQTLQMQKQYTGSNFKFMRRFKMDKYVKRDNIYRQKQFESTFSVLWSSKQANSFSQGKNRPVKSMHSTETFKNIPMNKSLKVKSSSKIHLNQTIY